MSAVPPAPLRVPGESFGRPPSGPSPTLAATVWPRCARPFRLRQRPAVGAACRPRFAPAWNDCGPRLGRLAPGPFPPRWRGHPRFRAGRSWPPLRLLPAPATFVFGRGRAALQTARRSPRIRRRLGISRWRIRPQLWERPRRNPARAAIGGMETAIIALRAWIWQTPASQAHTPAPDTDAPLAPRSRARLHAALWPPHTARLAHAIRGTSSLPV